VNGNGNGAPPPPPPGHTCAGPWTPDTQSLLISYGRVLRSTCPHGHQKHERVQGDRLVAFVPAAWIPHREIDAAAPRAAMFRSNPGDYPSDCWFCVRARRPPCSRHGGLGPRTRNRFAAEDNYREKKAKGRAEEL
jgi:hypothetical protein